MENGINISAKICLFFTVAMSILLPISIFIVTIVILSVSGDEHPNKPIRVWLGVFLGLWFLTTILNCTATSTTTLNDVVVSESGCTNSNVTTLLQLISLVWWGVGMYWIISGGEKLKDEAPMLFWYTAVLLGIGAAILVLQLCMFSCVCCCGTTAAAIFMRAASAEEADGRV